MNRRTDNSGQGKRRYLSENEMAELLDAELLKPARRMDMDLILEGLDYFDPFDAEEDAAEAGLALERFLERYPLFREEGKRRAIAGKKKLVLVAAIILVLILGVCSALGVWKVAYQWLSDSLFMRITSEGGAVLQADEPAHRATEIWSDALYDLMEEHGIEVSLPTWMPEEMELVYSEALELEDDFLIIDAMYETVSDKEVILVIRSLPESDLPDALSTSHYYEADYELRETVEYNEREYYMLTNLSYTTLTWSKEGIDVHLNVPCDRVNGIHIIESIE